jgi:hypothetical protein
VRGPAKKLCAVASVNQPRLQTCSPPPTAPASLPAQASLILISPSSNPSQQRRHPSPPCRKTLRALAHRLSGPSPAMFTRSIALRLTRCSSCPKASPRGVAYRPSHQRRPSSSKASSVPPNGAPSRGRSSAPSSSSGQPQESSSSGRSRGGKKAKLFAADRDFANLPAVPPTHHLGLESKPFSGINRSKMLTFLAQTSASRRFSPFIAPYPSRHAFRPNRQTTRSPPSSSPAAPLDGINCPK